MRRRRAWAAAALALVTVVPTACSTDDGAAPAGSSESPSTPTTSTTPTTSSVPTPTAPATAVPAPPRGGCYDLTYAEAVAPTVEAEPVSCDGRYTATTFAVGALDTEVGGHLLAVDSDRVRQQVAETCPRLFDRFVGGTTTDRRLSMLRAVWFTPTLAESDAGADWYRCDLIAIAAPERLAPLTGGLRGILDRPAGRARWGMCGTAAPDDPSFRRVLCSTPHTWRAIEVVDLPGRSYPGEAAARARGQGACEDAGREVAEDPLDFQWGYEWPTRAQWEAGQTFGRCWAPV